MTMKICFFYKTVHTGGGGGAGGGGGGGGDIHLQNVQKAHQQRQIIRQRHALITTI